MKFSRLRTRVPLKLVGSFKIELSNHSVPYIVKRSGRAASARLEIKRDGLLTVVIPRYISMEEVPGLIKSKSDWVLTRLDKYEQIQRLHNDQKTPSIKVLPFLGENLEVIHQMAGKSTKRVVLHANKLLVTTCRGDNSSVPLLMKWYRKQASIIMQQRVAELSSLMGVDYKRVLIRGQKTRWGSCSQNGNINLNWRLLMTPIPVIDYVIIHELAHIKEMNHSKRFWQMVSRYCPDWRTYRKWLKTHEAELAMVCQ